MPKKVLCVKGDQVKWFDEEKIADGWVMDYMVDAPAPIFVVPDGMKLVPVDSDGDKEPQVDEKDGGISDEAAARNPVVAGSGASTFNDGTPAKPKKPKIGKL